VADRWRESGVPRGAAYDRRFDALAATGMDVHGEADLVDSYGPGSVLDAGCGTGRVAIELSRRGHRVVGSDVDEAMLEAARAKAPDLDWVRGDLADPALDFGQAFDVVVMAGNVLIFVPSGSEEQVIANAARWLRPGGLLVTGYSLQPGGFGPGRHDVLATRAGLVLRDRWSTWERHPFSPGDRYAVAVHQREG
jgi:SAM-dependent methyltransferase